MNVNDCLDAALTKLAAADHLVPPADMIFVGDGPYLKISGEFLRYFATMADLRPDQSIFEIGSGIGRIAAGLSFFLDPETGTYSGFDPVEMGVGWCVDAYKAHGNMRFHWADIHNELYRPKGKLKSSDYTFPVADQSTDLAIAISVFTHLYEADIAAYLKESARILKPEGKFFATVFSFSGARPESSKHDHLKFNSVSARARHRWHVSSQPPLLAVCYSEPYLKDLVATCLGREAKIFRGRWNGGEGPWFQDVLIA